jgi:hypothetical protein
MPRYIYGISRRSLTGPDEPRVTTAQASSVPEPEPTSYRDLQKQAKELGIPGNQTREELEAAIAEKST